MPLPVSVVPCIAEFVCATWYADDTAQTIEGVASTAVQLQAAAQKGTCQL